MRYMLAEIGNYEVGQNDVGARKWSRPKMFRMQNPYWVKRDRFMLTWLLCFRWMYYAVWIKGGGIGVSKTPYSHHRRYCESR